MIPSLPQELYDEIIGHLQNGTRRDRKALRSCSLTCRAFLHSARTYIYRRVFITYELGELERGRRYLPGSRLYLLLSESPHLVAYIQELLITGRMTPHAPFKKDVDLRLALDILSERGQLHSVVLAFINWTQPDSLPPEMRRSLENLLAVKSLHSVVLKSIIGCPPTVFERFTPALKLLGLIDTVIPKATTTTTTIARVVRLEHFSIHLDTQFQFFGWKAIDTVLPRTSDWPIDVTQLRSFEAFVWDIHSWHFFRDMIQNVAGSIQELHLRTVTLSGWFSSLDLSEFPFLRRISLDLLPHWSAENGHGFGLDIVLKWLARSLDHILTESKITSLSITHTIKHVSFGFQWDVCKFNSAIGDATWKELDTTLSRLSAGSAKSFRGIHFQFNIALNQHVRIYNDINALLREKLRHTRKLGKLHVWKARKECRRKGMDADSTLLMNNNPILRSRLM